MATGRFSKIYPSHLHLGPGDHEGAGKTVEYEITVHGKEPAVIEVPLGVEIGELEVVAADKPTLVRYRIPWAKSPEYHEWCAMPYKVYPD